MKQIFTQKHQTAKMNSKVRLLSILLCLVGICVFWRGYMSPYMSYPIYAGSCACRRCLSEANPWFMQRFNKSVEPFLSAKYSLTEDAFNWWKRLQLEKRNFTFYKKTADAVFQMFPSSPHVEPRSNYCRTCAVVGNSGNLKGSYYGPIIDYHDFIIRMNSGPTKGYEADVGTRTTHRVLYPESAVDLESTTHLVLVPFKIMDMEWVMKALSTGFHRSSYMPVRSHIKANKDLVMVVNPAFMRYVHDVWLEKKGKYPSTGFLALVLAVHMCDEIDVFGYGADSDGNWNHYWEQLRNKQLKTGLHPGNQEYDMIQKLEKQQVLRFYQGQ